MVQLYPNPWCSHLQTNRLGAEEAGFLVGVHDGASWHSVCGVHQVWPLGHNGEPVARTSWSQARVEGRNRPLFRLEIREPPTSALRGGE